MILGWFTTQTFQEQFKKLSHKSQPGGAKNSHLAIFLGHSVFLMYLNTVSTSHPTFGINQVHFIPHVSVLWSFYQCLACCNESFSAPSTARFIVWSHFGAMSACSNLCVPHTINPAHCLPRAMHVYSASVQTSHHACFSSYFDVRLSLLLVSEILDWPCILCCFPTGIHR